jgi:hypothetical protein
LWFHIAPFGTRASGQQGPHATTDRRRRSSPPPGTNVPLVSSVEELVGDYNNPILKPQAAEVVKKHGESELAGIPTATPRSQCWPEGVPFALGNMGMQMIQQQDKIIILTTITRFAMSA